jgi:hypothetical protein
VILPFSTWNRGNVLKSPNVLLILFVRDLISYPWLKE